MFETLNKFSVWRKYSGIQGEIITACSVISFAVMDYMKF
jgi:hypothetical protein